jgi:aminopeptidase
LSDQKLDELELERYTLAQERLTEIASGQAESVVFGDFFRQEAGFLLEMDRLRIELEQGLWEQKSIGELEVRNQKLYGELLPEQYAHCYGNPAYAAKMTGDAYGKYFSFLYAEFRGAITFAFEDRPWDLLVLMELLLECYNLFEEEKSPEQALSERIYWYNHDYTQAFVEKRIEELLNPELSFAKDLIMRADFSDPAYLYQFGEYVTENELVLARYLAGLPQEEIDAIARTWTEGYRIGFEVQDKDLSKKKTVNLRYRLGFERVIRSAVKQFEEMHLQSVIYRPAAHSVNRRSQIRIGYYGALPNQQFDYDHKNDCAFYLDDRFVSNKLAAQRMAFEKYKKLASVHGGPAVMEVFGEIPFNPESNPAAVTLTEEQQKLLAHERTESAQISNRYIKGEERSFTIIAYPVPEIGDDFENIFKETIRINNLDYQLYQRIQQKLIDALDQGSSVHVSGMNGNRTDLTIQLHHLTDPEHQTNFENCVADVNIPVGEVFTSPVLTGTSGILHVSRVYLGEFEYIDLEIHLKDGMVCDYRCANFEKEEENKRYIEENILFHHPTVPIGEFAIGTNTTAYRMARIYGIAAKLPILIAEKTGPHFAFGDTCYSFQEDMAVYNPDGKEIIARDNECSLKRKSDPSKAYFGCHTDVTIPYEELGAIDVIRPDGSSQRLLEKGRFVLPGTEELNKPLEDI